ncbi:hypothetical protein B4Q13_19765, partial [Lacticaseibacillus rhamnosus]
ERWADRHNVIMTIELDRQVGEQDCEEVIGFRSDVNSPCFLLIWRDAEAVSVQTSVGFRRRYRSVSRVLDNLVFT